MKPDSFYKNYTIQKKAHLDKNSKPEIGMDSVFWFI